MASRRKHGGEGNRVFGKQKAHTDGRPPPATHPARIAIDESNKQMCAYSKPFFNQIMTGEPYAEVNGVLDLSRFPPTVSRYGLC